MTAVRVSLVDVYVLRDGGDRGDGGDGRKRGGVPGFEVLVLRRAPCGRCPGSWETVHGHIEAGETPMKAAVRELAEETGFAAARLYNLSRVEQFYQHGIDEVALVPVFVAFVAAGSPVRLGAEHDASEWLSFADARARLAWPRERRALDDVEQLLGAGGAGPLEDVLRVC